MKYHNAAPLSSNGFTLVEISIVIVIIGLLIGGVFGGMKLIDNANVQKTVQDLKATESAISRFKDLYQALPGDIRNPNILLSGCADAPCATGGNENSILEPSTFTGAITNASEVYTVWHHLRAADMLDMGLRNTLVTRFGRGQPQSAIGGGLRISSTNINMPWGFCPNNFVQGAAVWVSVNQPISALDGTSSAAPCTLIEAIDIKMDDGLPHMGEFTSGWGCDPVTCLGPYQNPNNRGVGFYDFKGF